MATRLNISLASAAAVVALCPFVAATVNAWADTPDALVPDLAQFVRWHSDIGPIGGSTPNPEWKCNLSAIEWTEMFSALPHEANRSMPPAQSSSVAEQHSTRAASPASAITR
jgi:hypothetical protein